LRLNQKQIQIVIGVLFPIHKDNATGALTLSGNVELPGSVAKGWDRKRWSLLFTDRAAFVGTTEALYVLDCAAAGPPRVLATLPQYASRTQYWGHGSGVLDMTVQHNRLYIAAGRSRWPRNKPPPDDRAVWRDDLRFRQRTFREDYLAAREFVGGVHILDITDLTAPRPVAVIDDEWLGFGWINHVRVSGTTLVACARDVGLIFVDIRKPLRPEFLSVLSTNGEVEYARPIGARVYAVGNGVYTIDPDGAPGRQCSDFAYTNSWMFGGFVLSNPLPRHNPTGMLYAEINGNHRELVPVDGKLLVRDYAPAQRGRGQWTGEFLFSPIPYKSPQTPPFGIEIWRIAPDGASTRVARAECSVPVTHVLRHGNRLFGVFLTAHGKVPAGPYLAVFDVVDPLHPTLTATLNGPIDAGGMRSSDPYYYRGFLFLPGWLAMAKRTEGGFGGFPGVRVLDVRDPDRPKAHALINHFPADISVNALVSAQNFHAEGNTLYVADYWHGIVVFDISDLADSGAARHLATIKHEPQPWSVASYCTSVAGRASRLYSTHFGELKTWDIPCASDVPSGNLSVRLFERQED